MTEKQMQEFQDNSIRTKIPLRRMGQPDDIATVAVFLASSAARYVTGETMVVDSGMLLT
jgi:NAD(P)-dependent dehydrogenase (short-subunit alcohol dehydrogenase family)